MRKKTALILLDDWKNKYSINALWAMLEQDPSFDDLTIKAVEETGLAGALKEAYPAHERTVVGFSCTTIQFDTVRMQIKNIRSSFGNNVHVMVGGSHPTGEPETVLQAGADTVFLGESEISFAEYLKKLDSDSDIRKVPGTAYLDEKGRLRFTGDRKPADLDLLPPFPVKVKRIGPIEIVRGCPHACAYCQTSRIFGTRQRSRSVENISRWIEIMARKNLRDFRACAPDGFSYGSPEGNLCDLEKLEELLRNAKKITGRKGHVFYATFPSEVRPEHVTEGTLGLVRKYCDNKEVKIGCQSGSPVMLKKLNRSHSVDDIIRAVELTLKAGLTPLADFLYEIPGETGREKDMTSRLVKRLVKMGAKIRPHKFMILPDTSFQSAEKR
jgi:B12-binding domain/radical SAM domain protein